MANGDDPTERANNLPPSSMISDHLNDSDAQKDANSAKNLANIPQDDLGLVKEETKEAENEEINLEDKDEATTKSDKDSENDKDDKDFE